MLFAWNRLQRWLGTGREPAERISFEYDLGSAEYKANSVEVTRPPT